MEDQPIKPILKTTDGALRLQRKLEKKSLAANKPCGYCGGQKHLAYQCYRNPKNIERLHAAKPCKYCQSVTHRSYRCPNMTDEQKQRRKTRTKLSFEWQYAKAEWYKQNPPDHNGFYWCKIPQCIHPGEPMRKKEVTLDHIIPRSKRPDLRMELSNLQPSHWDCNTLKGSVYGEDYERYEAREKA